MGRNLIQRPRFFVDFAQYWQQRGTFPKSLYLFHNNDELTPNIFSLSLDQQFETVAPSGVNEISFKLFFNGMSGTQTNGINTALPMHVINEIEQMNYFAIFGHNFKTQKLMAILRVARGQDGDIQSETNSSVYTLNSDEISNCTISTNTNESWMVPNYNGTSIMGFDGWSSNLHANDGTGERDAVKFIELVIKKADASQFDGTEIISLSGISMGRTYTMPRSPDLKTSISYDYGIKSQDGIDGTTFEQIDWIEPKKLPT